MMSRKDSLYPEAWKKAAQKDLHRIEIMLREEDEEGAAYFLQQALEKYLKAFLLKQGWKLKKIHDLDSLLDEALKHKPDLKKYMELCERVSGYYFTERYPMLELSDLTIDDVRKDLKEANELVNR